MTIARLGYSEGGFPTAYWPVGYPGFLGVLFWIFGKTQIVGQLANLALSTTTLYLLLLLTRHIFENERTARLSALLLTIYPNNIAYSSILMSEIYITFILMLGTYLLLVKKEWYWLLLCGLVYGLAALTKPQLIFLPLLIIALGEFDHRTIQPNKKILASLIIIYSAIACVLLPWTIRNTLNFNQLVVISTNGGTNLLIGNNPSATGGYMEIDQISKELKFSVTSQVAFDKLTHDLAIEWIKDNPLHFLQLIPKKIWYLWAPDGEAEWYFQSGYRMYDQQQFWFRLVRIVNQVYYIFLMLCFLRSTINFAKLKAAHGWPYNVLPIILMAYLTIISSVFFGSSRFHFPAMPCIIMAVAWVLNDFLKIKHENLIN